MHDPTTLNRQGNDSGTQYRSAIYFHTPEQLLIVNSVTEKAKQHYKSLSTEIKQASIFYPAEDYHQVIHSFFNN
jgi:peptide-methionine (S)-S-oxide reductase